MSYQGEFMGLAEVSTFGTKQSLSRILERWDLEISIIKGKRTGLDNEKKIKWDHVTGNAILLAVMIILLIALISRAIATFPPASTAAAMQFISSLLLSVMLAGATAHRVFVLLTKILEYRIFIEAKPYRNYVYSTNITSYYKLQDYYTGVIVELEKRRAVFQKMQGKLNKGEELSEEDIKKIENIKELDYHYHLKPFYDYKVRLSEYFTYLKRDSNTHY